MYNQLNYATAGVEPWTCEEISKADYSYTRRQAAQIHQYILENGRHLTAPVVVLTVRARHRMGVCKCYEEQEKCEKHNEAESGETQVQESDDSQEIQASQEYDIAEEQEYEQTFEFSAQCNECDEDVDVLEEPEDYEQCDQEQEDQECEVEECDAQDYTCEDDVELAEAPDDQEQHGDDYTNDQNCEVEEGNEKELTHEEEKALVEIQLTRAELEKRFRDSLDQDQPLVIGGKRYGIYDVGSMYKLNKSHYQVYSQLIRLLPKNWYYYVPGDGDGIMSYLLWKYKYKYYSSEPSQLGQVAVDLGIMKREGYRGDFKCDCVLALNIYNDFTLSPYHLSRRFVVVEDKSFNIPDWMYTFCVVNTRARVFTNVLECAWAVPSLRPSSTFVQRVKDLPIYATYAPQDEFHTTMLREFGYQLSHLDGSRRIGRGYLDLLTGQDHFEPNALGVFYGKEGDYYFVDHQVCRFSEGKNVIDLADGARIVECKRRQRIVYTLSVRDQGVYVKLARYKPYVRARLTKRGQEYVWYVHPGGGPLYRVEQQETMKYRPWMYGKVLYPGKSPS